MGIQVYHPSSPLGVASDIGSLSGPLTLDPGNGRIQRGTLAGDVVFARPGAADDGTTIDFWLILDSAPRQTGYDFFPSLAYITGHQWPASGAEECYGFLRFKVMSGVWQPPLAEIVTYSPAGISGPFREDRTRARQVAIASE